MSLKNELILLLESNRERDLSGEDLARQLGVSRAAVWKTVNALRMEGYQVEAGTNRGYHLAASSDCLSEEGIRLFLKKSYQQNRIFVLDTVDSTNNYAKKQAVAQGQHGDVFVANEQTAGKGRLGRSFYSPAGTGIYMSFLLKPGIPLEQAVLCTVTAAVAVCLAIEECTGKKPTIKWVNDIFVDGKKVCGILTEAISDFETGMAESVIVGVGINVKTQSDQFPPELRKIAASLGETALQRNRLAASVVNHFMNLLQESDRAGLLANYKARSMVLGRQLTYVKNGETYKGRAMDINEDANLIIRHEDGSRSVLKSGEISIGSENLL